MLLQFKQGLQIYNTYIIFYKIIYLKGITEKSNTVFPYCLVHV